MSQALAHVPFQPREALNRAGNVSYGTPERANARLATEFGYAFHNSCCEPGRVSNVNGRDRHCLACFTFGESDEKSGQAEYAIRRHRQCSDLGRSGLGLCRQRASARQRVLVCRVGSPVVEVQVGNTYPVYVQPQPMYVQARPPT